DAALAAGWNELAPARALQRMGDAADVRTVARRRVARARRIDRRLRGAASGLTGGASLGLRTTARWSTRRPHRVGRCGEPRRREQCETRPHAVLPAEIAGSESSAHATDARMHGPKHARARPGGGARAATAPASRALRNASASLPGASVKATPEVRRDDRRVPRSDELLMTREPERDDELPGTRLPGKRGVEDLSAGDPELLVPDAAEQVQTLVAQDDSLHLEVAAPGAVLVLVRAVAPHAADRTPCPPGPQPGALPTELHSPPSLRCFARPRFPRRDRRARRDSNP